MAYISISTAQNIDVEYELAGVGNRLLAALLDGIFMAAYILVCFWILSLTGSGDMMSALFFILWIPIMLYHLLFELFMNGQSLGKKIMKIKVISLSGTQPSFGQYLLRWLFRLVDITISQGAIAVISIAVTNKAQRLGDLVANTTVVSTRPKRSLQETLYSPNVESYQLVYPEVVNLSVEDVQLIKEVLMMQHKEQGYYLAVETANKIESILQIKRTQDPLGFLRTIIADYNHII